MTEHDPTAIPGAPALAPLPPAEDLPDLEPVDPEVMREEAAAAPMPYVGPSLLDVPEPPADERAKLEAQADALAAAMEAGKPGKLKPVAVELGEPPA